jgi:hypothetical protein
MTYTHAGLDYEIAKEKGGLQLNPEPAQPGSESSDVEGCKAA